MIAGRQRVLVRSLRGRGTGQEQLILGERMVSERADVLSGDARRFGPYQLCARIGAGGMATVYLARDERRAGIQRFVAVKRIHERLAADHRYVSMFLDEAHIGSQIRHPNVCAVYDYGTYDDEHYLAMEYLSGETMAAVWRAMRGADAASDGKRRAALVGRLMAEVCEGLHAAHELRDLQGNRLAVVHRDVSPENLFVTYDGIAKVVDFGTLKASRQRHKTQTGTVKGKVAYLQPEVLRGGRPDRRADIWSVGVVTWELLTGRRLFKRKTDLATVQAVTRRTVPAPSTVRSGIPASLDAVVLKALTRDPDARYESARELARQIHGALASEALCAGSGEVSEWLDGMFPHGRACQEQLLALAAGFVVPACGSDGGAVPSRSRRRCVTRPRERRVIEPSEVDEETRPARTELWSPVPDEPKAAGPAARRDRAEPSQLLAAALPRRRLRAVMATLCLVALGALLGPASLVRTFARGQPPWLGSGIRTLDLGRPYESARPAPPPLDLDLPDRGEPMLELWAKAGGEPRLLMRGPLAPEPSAAHETGRAPPPPPR
jgi:eukaryotic-like serine/threonine-protein kinase